MPKPHLYIGIAEKGFEPGCRIECLSSLEELRGRLRDGKQSFFPFPKWPLVLK